MTAQRRPNVLFLMTDQQRPDMAGFLGNGVVRTPNMDWIASEGVVFENAYTPSPVCIPARQSMMSGKLPRSCGCERFGEDLPPFYQTFARTFSQNAYNTVCCGKLHHTGPDQMQGWLQRIGSECCVAPRNIPGLDADELMRVRSTQAELRWTNAKELLRAGPGHARNTIQDEYATQGALDAIENILQSPYYDKEQPRQPLLLKVSYVLPHYPYFCDEQLFKYYLNRVPIFCNQQLSGHPYLDTKRVEIGTEVRERDVRRTVAAYYAMTETVDGMMGRVLNKLREAGQELDDWIIVLTSDHGEMLGEHGIWAKHKFYEASVRVPLVIRWPKRFAPRRVSQNVNLCDLYATLCDLCGLDIPEDLDSRSLAALMAGESNGWSNETVSQYDGQYLMIKQDNLKYQYYGETMPEVLFDLKADPGELINFIDDPAYGTVVAALRKRRNALGFDPLGCKDYKSAGYSPRGR